MPKLVSMLVDDLAPVRGRRRARRCTTAGVFPSRLVGLLIVPVRDLVPVRGGRTTATIGRGFPRSFVGRPILPICNLFPAS